MRSEPYTVKEAADVLHVADKTIRRMLDRGELIEQSRDEQGRILITAESVTEQLRQVSSHESRQVSNDEVRQAVEVLLPAVTEQDAGANPIVQTLLVALDKQSARIAELGERAGRAEERAEQLEQQLEQARAELDRVRQESRQVSNPATEAELQRYKQEVERLHRRNFWQWLLGR